MRSSFGRIKKEYRLFFPPLIFWIRLISLLYIPLISLLLWYHGALIFSAHKMLQGQERKKTTIVMETFYTQ